MDIAKLQELMKSKKASMKRVERTAKINPGKNRVRILQGWKAGEEHVWYQDFGQHFIKDATDQIKAVYVCASATHETTCGVCDALAAASRMALDDDTQNVLGKAKASRTVLVNALMLDSTEPNTPVILELKRGVFGQLLEILEENGPEAFFDLTAGHELIINRDGKGLNTTYTAQMAIKVGAAIPAAVLTRLNNLDEYVKQESDEQERRAIAAVNSVAGFLPAPSAADVPRVSGGGNAGRLPAPIEFDDVPDLKAAPVKRADVALDDELDSLLGDLAD